MWKAWYTLLLEDCQVGSKGYFKSGWCGLLPSNVVAFLGLWITYGQTSGVTGESAAVEWRIFFFLLIPGWGIFAHSPCP